MDQTSQRINEFSFVYMFNPILYTNKVFRDQVKACSKHTFGPDTNKHIHKIWIKQNTRVLELVVFNEPGNIIPREMFKVLICVVYIIIDRYVCIDYLGTEIKKISELRICCTLKTKHEGMEYDNLFSIGIPDILLNILSCHVFLNNNESIVVLKCPIRMSEYYFNKVFIQLTSDEDHLNKLSK